MRLILILPDTEYLKNALSTCRESFKKVPWIKASELGDEENALAQRLSQDDCKNGYVVEDFGGTLEDLKHLDQQLKELNKNAQLPLGLYWSGKPKKEQREVIKAYRAEQMPLTSYLYGQRRLISVLKAKKLAKGFKEAASRSRKVQLLRRGTSGAFVAALIIILVGVLFFRNPFLEQLLVDQAQSQLQARFELLEFDTSLSDLGLHLSGVQAADAQEPMKNIVECEAVHASWDLAALTSLKLHAEELTVSGLQFGTERTKSGALAGAEIPVPEEPVNAEPENSAFLDALMNSMGDFKPPAVEDLETTQVINALKAGAQDSQAVMSQKTAAIDVDQSVAESMAASAELKKISFVPADANNLQADLDKNKIELAALSEKTKTDVATVQETLQTLKAFKVEDPKKDLKEAKELIEASKSVTDQIKSIKTNVAKSKQLLAASQSSVDQAAKDMQAQGEKAKKELNDSLTAVRAPLTKAAADINAISDESQALAKKLRDAKDDINKAIEQDVSTARKQYSVDGIKTGSEKLIQELIGMSVYESLETGFSYYTMVKPYLPVSAKKKKVKKKGAAGTTYDFPLAAEEGGMADVWIKKALLDGQFPVSGDTIQFTGSLLDFTSNMAFTHKPVQLKLEGASADEAKQLMVDLHYDTDQLLKGSVRISGLQMEAMETGGNSNTTGITPQSISGNDISLQLSNLSIGDDQRNGLIEIVVKDLKLSAPSGKDVHPEVAAVFTETYANLKNITIKIGMGDEKTFRTEPDIAQLIASGLNRRIEAKMDGARQKAEAAIRAHGEAQLGDLDKLAASVAAPKELSEKQQALAQATTKIDALEGTEQKRLVGDEEAALKGLETYKQDLSEQGQAVDEQQSQLDKISDKIEKERKRIEQELLGGSLKDKLKLPKF